MARGATSSHADAVDCGDGLRSLLLRDGLRLGLGLGAGGLHLRLGLLDLLARAQLVGNGLQLVLGLPAVAVAVELGHLVLAQTDTNRCRLDVHVLSQVGDAVLEVAGILGLRGILGGRLGGALVVLRHDGVSFVPVRSEPS